MTASDSMEDNVTYCTVIALHVLLTSESLFSHLVGHLDPGCQLLREVFRWFRTKQKGFLFHFLL